jgi:hypothetical protein
MTRGYQRIAITCLHLIALFIPVLGQILATIMVIRDNLSLASRALWLVIIWIFPFLGPLLYMFFARQRQNRRQ